MELCVKTFDDETYVIEVGVDDTAAVMRRKVASAVGLPEDGFHMRFGGEALGAGADMAQLSVGDTIELTKTERYDIVAALHALGETDITAEQLDTVEDPEVACLLLQAGVATVIPHEFLRSGSFTELDLSVELPVTEVGSYFLAGCILLTRVDLSGLCNVKEIGDGFLQRCPSLTAIDFSALCNVQHIGEGCLAYCRSLRTIDLSGLRNVTEIGDSLLSGCTSLTTVDLSGLRNVRNIGDGFLQQCHSLTTIDISALCNVKHIGAGFLAHSPSLSTVDLSGCNTYLSTALKGQNHINRFSSE